MSDYPAEDSYKVYIIGRATQPGMRADGLSAYELFDTHRDFPIEELAEQWIQNEGERQVPYTILKVWRKK